MTDEAVRQMKLMHIYSRRPKTSSLSKKSGPAIADKELEEDSNLKSLTKARTKLRGITSESPAGWLPGAQCSHVPNIYVQHFQTGQ